MQMLPCSICITLFRFAMLRVFSAKRTELAQLKLRSRVLFVFLGCVISTLAITTRKEDIYPHSLLHDFGNNTSANSTSTFANREANTLFHGDRTWRSD